MYGGKGPGAGLTGTAAAGGGTLAVTGSPIVPLVVVALAAIVIGLLLMRTSYVRKHQP